MARLDGAPGFVFLSALALALAGCGGGRAAAPAAPAADVATTAEPAAPAEGAAIAIGRAGVGPLAGLIWWAQDEDATAALIATRLGALDGVSASFAVLDVPGEVEREEGYWSVVRGEAEIAYVLRQSGPAGDTPAAVVVWTADIPTASGVRVGDTVGAALARHPDLACRAEADGTVAQGLVAADLQCASPAAPEIIFLVAPGDDDAAGPVAPRAIPARSIVGIAHEPG